MPPQVGQVTIAKPGGSSSTNGLLNIPVKQTQLSSKNASKASGPRLKILIRRLAPELSQAEFERLLGEEWKVGEGRVDWMKYKRGKLSTEYVRTSTMEHGQLRYPYSIVPP